MLVFVEYDAEAVAPAYAQTGSDVLRGDRRGQWRQRPGVGDSLMGRWALPWPA
jgi:hypothetical protein